MDSPESRAWKKDSCESFTEIQDSKEKVWVTVSAKQARKKSHYKCTSTSWSPLLTIGFSVLQDCLTCHMKYVLELWVERKNIYLPAPNAHWSKFTPSVLIPNISKLHMCRCSVGFHGTPCCNINRESPGWDTRDASDRPEASAGSRSDPL